MTRICFRGCCIDVALSTPSGPYVESEYFLALRVTLIGGGVVESSVTKSETLKK